MAVFIGAILLSTSLYLSDYCPDLGNIILVFIILYWGFIGILVIGLVLICICCASFVALAQTVKNERDKLLNKLK